ncbi:tetratricopeptide repeat-containing sulfotransferase family protein [Kordiimonas sp.]|uniref:tetratricopeptide repeat-containing sulfotransferase family protein n=1 Tax=Kordiimonas sp. TaxID=1970157 RepID=UPI003A91673E
MSTAQAQDFLRRGYRAMQQGDFREAGGCCSLVLKHFPKAKEAHFLVGLIGIESGDWATAKRAFRNVVSLDEAHTAGWAQLARCCVTMGQYNLAEKALHNAVATGTDDPLVMDVIGNVYSLLGDQLTALDWFDRAAAKARTAFFELSRAKALTFLGRLDEAKAALAAVLAEKPDAALVHWMLGRLRTAKETDHIEAMTEIADRMPDGHPDAPFIQYAIGKDHEDLGNWDEAFKAYAAGAQARRKLVDHDEAAEENLFETLKNTLSKSWFDAQAGGHDDAAPIFIVGQPRTGTTLIERIVTAHSDVESAGELQQFGMAIKRMSEMSSPRPMTAEIVAKAAGANMSALGELYLETTKAVRGDSPRFVDKLPVNYLYLPIIAAALPNAKIIHIVRDPMDSCFASYKQLFADAYYHSYDQQEMARHHVRYRDLMDQWREVLGERILDVVYEDTVTSLEPNARKIIDFLGLEWQDACLSFHEQASAVTTASAAQVREAAHTRSVGRWKKFEKHLEPMKSVLEEAGLLELPA